MLIYGGPGLDQESLPLAQWQEEWLFGPPIWLARLCALHAEYVAQRYRIQIGSLVYAVEIMTGRVSFGTLEEIPQDWWPRFLEFQEMPTAISEEYHYAALRRLDGLVVPVDPARLFDSWEQATASIVVETLAEVRNPFLSAVRV